MGLFVFVITAVAMILFIIGFNSFSLKENESFYRYLRSAELLLTLAATGLIVAIIGRAQKPFVLAIGIFLIGALIVPSKDIVRFALIASGSDRNYESFFQSATPGIEISGRNTDVANNIINELNQADLMESLQPGNRKSAIRIIVSAIKQEREITLVEKVGARGALVILNAMASNIQALVYKYGKIEKFIEDLKYLRSEGLITYPYDDLDTTAITPLGRAVLRRAFPAEFTVASGGIDQLIPDFYAPLSMSCPSDITPTLFTDETDELLSDNGRPMRITSDPKYVQFTVKNTDDYNIEIKVQDQNLAAPTDPVLFLFKLTTENDCVQLGFNDDFSEILDSQLSSLRLVPGTYLIGTKSIQNEGHVRIFVEKK